MGLIWKYNYVHNICTVSTTNTSTPNTSTNSSTTNTSTPSTSTNSSTTNTSTPNTSTNSSATNTSTPSTSTNSSTTNTSTPSTSTNSSTTNTSTPSTSTNSSTTNTTSTTSAPTTSSTTNIPPAPQNATQIFNLTFSINETFDSALASNSSPQFGAKAANIRSQVEPLYKKTFKNFILMQILRFKNGSIITESKLYMDPSGSNVTATQVKDVLLNGISNGNLTFQIDRGSINVTEIGNSTPPVIASSVSMICMSLLSLLLSLALHF
ncbi:hypothetical protein KOW79_022763 [Hemibagrus wyckioides]|uniref:SEA domain-containing protein n=1 Tax=Hemibagrus wyckioides TaxID=337641 RepID=A0A9D3N4I8_9TELE|nr:hypothetical protein KOW79_022763 [Hemibagrus wyckioides]